MFAGWLGLALALGCGGGAGGDTGLSAPAVEVAAPELPTDAPAPDAGGDAQGVVPDQGPLTLCPLWTSPERRIVDDAGREVLLRGANVTSLSEYWEGDPAHPPTLPTTAAGFEAMNQLFLAFGQKFGVPAWIGEYGFWSTDDATLQKLARYAADEDRRLLGGAGWQWRQPCGDPHSVGPTGDSVVTHLRQLGCPGDVDLGPTEPFQRVLGRGYPRAAPGRLTRLLSDPQTGAPAVEAQADEAGGVLLVWTPTPAVSHGVSLEGLEDPVQHALPGGRLLEARVSAPGPYALRVLSR